MLFLMQLLMDAIFILIKMFGVMYILKIKSFFNKYINFRFFYSCRHGFFNFNRLLFSYLDAYL